MVQRINIGNPGVVFRSSQPRLETLSTSHGAADLHLDICLRIEPIQFAAHDRVEGQATQRNRGVPGEATARVSPAVVVKRHGSPGVGLAHRVNNSPPDFHQDLIAPRKEQTEGPAIEIDACRNFESSVTAEPLATVIATAGGLKHRLRAVLRKSGAIKPNSVKPEVTDDFLAEAVQDLSIRGVVAGVEFRRFCVGLTRKLEEAHSPVRMNVRNRRRGAEGIPAHHGDSGFMRPVDQISEGLPTGLQMEFGECPGRKERKTLLAYGRKPPGLDAGLLNDLKGLVHILFGRWAITAIFHPRNAFWIRLNGGLEPRVAATQNRE